MSDDEHRVVAHIDSVTETPRGMVAAGGWCAPLLTTYNLTGMDRRFRTTRLWNGTEEPTEEDIHSATEWLREEYQREMVAWQETQHLLGLVERTAFLSTSREIMALHSRTGNGHCAHCTFDEDDEFAEPSWPCETVRIILKAASIDVPDELVYEMPVEPTPDPDNPRWPFPSGPVEAFGFPSVEVTRGGIRYDTESSQ